MILLSTLVNGFAKVHVPKYSEASIAIGHALPLLHVRRVGGFFFCLVCAIHGALGCSERGDWGVYHHPCVSDQKEESFSESADSERVPV